jgi:hypothetical protein
MACCAVRHEAIKNAATRPAKTWWNRGSSVGMSGQLEIGERDGDKAGACAHRPGRGRPNVQSRIRRPSLTPCTMRQSKRILRLCVLSVGAGLVVFLGTLVQHTWVLHWERGLDGRRQGASGGSVRFLVSLTAQSDKSKAFDFVNSNTSAIVGALARSVARAMRVVEKDVSTFKTQLVTPTLMDVGLEIKVAAGSDTSDRARLLRSQVDDGKVSEALILQGLLLTAKLRSIPRPFSVAGLPEVFGAADQADVVLLSALFAPIIILLPVLVYSVFEYQLVERCVRTRSIPPTLH